MTVIMALRMALKFTVICLDRETIRRGLLPPPTRRACFQSSFLTGFLEFSLEKEECNFAQAFAQACKAVRF